MAARQVNKEKDDRKKIVFRALLRVIGGMEEREQAAPKRRYTWPWFLLATVLLGIALAILWVSFAAKRVRELRDPNQPAPSSATPALAPHAALPPRPESARDE